MKASESKFTNKCGEDFSVKFYDIIVTIQGSETGGKEISLFNQSFNVYSEEELYKIGVALQEISGYRP